MSGASKEAREDTKEELSSKIVHRIREELRYFGCDECVMADFLSAL